MSKRKIIDKASINNEPKKRKFGHWNTGLLSAVDDPNLFVKSDDLVNVIKDKYPKAKYHYLIMPKEDISSLKQVTSKHAPLLKHMEDIAVEITSDKQHEGSTFQIGYHVEPSMVRLHLHVISDDMNSDCLKTKKHWNSFTTAFFVPSKEIRKNLEANGKVLLPSKNEWKTYMGTPLKCHKCNVKPKNMPDLKRHILTHLK